MKTNIIRTIGWFLAGFQVWGFTAIGKAIKYARQYDIKQLVEIALSIGAVVALAFVAAMMITYKEKSDKN